MWDEEEGEGGGAMVHPGLLFPRRLAALVCGPSS